MPGHKGTIEIVRELHHGNRFRFRLNIRAGNGVLLLSCVRWYPDRSKARQFAKNLIWLFRKRRIEIMVIK